MGGTLDKDTSYKDQADATINQAAPGSGTIYPVLTTKTNARIKSIGVICTWTVQPTPLEVHVAIDGKTVTYTFTDPVTITQYFADTDPDTGDAAQLLTVSDHAGYRAFLCEGKSIAVSAEITGGTVSNLSCRVKWAEK